MSSKVTSVKSFGMARLLSWLMIRRTSADTGSTTDKTMANRIFKKLRTGGKLKAVSNLVYNGGSIVHLCWQPLGVRGVSRDVFQHDSAGKRVVRVGDRVLVAQVDTPHRHLHGVQYLPLDGILQGAFLFWVVHTVADRSSQQQTKAKLPALSNPPPPKPPHTPCITVSCSDCLKSMILDSRNSERGRRMLTGRLQGLVPSCLSCLRLQLRAVSMGTGCRQQAASTPGQKKRFTPRRAVLYVPGNDQRKLEKIPGLDVDCAVLDCEDGVAANRKVEARETIAGMLDRLKFGRTECVVRVNAVSSGLMEEDLRVMFQATNLPETVMVPKMNSVQELATVTHTIQTMLKDRDIPHKLSLVLFVESALGLLNLREVCQRATELSLRSSIFDVDGLVFGSDDYCADIGVKLVTTAKAFRLQAIDMVHIDYKDLDGLGKQSVRGADMGFTGKQVIHPGQIPVVQEAFSPSPDRVEWATSLIEAFQQHQASGQFSPAGSDLDLDRHADRQFHGVLHALFDDACKVGHVLGRNFVNELIMKLQYENEARQGVQFSQLLQYVLRGAVLGPSRPTPGPTSPPMGSQRSFSILQSVTAADISTCVYVSSVPSFSRQAWKYMARCRTRTASVVARYRPDPGLAGLIPRLPTPIPPPIPPAPTWQLLPPVAPLIFCFHHPPYQPAPAYQLLPPVAPLLSCFHHPPHQSAPSWQLLPPVAPLIYCFHYPPYQPTPPWPLLPPVAPLISCFHYPPHQPAPAWQLLPPVAPLKACFHYPPHQSSLSWQLMPAEVQEGLNIGSRGPSQGCHCLKASVIEYSGSLTIEGGDSYKVTKFPLHPKCESTLELGQDQLQVYSNDVKSIFDIDLPEQFHAGIIEVGSYFHTLCEGYRPEISTIEVSPEPPCEQVQVRQGGTHTHQLYIEILSPTDENCDLGEEKLQQIATVGITDQMQLINNQDT
ncbi:CLYBL-like protein [Mya arenaria]|uniref:CLYBL-like protein n=1 Tax=Mya arenaria TaxID=6604 RepID=A0ABY7EA07_MYAAR|nr:CLYBL-like protein [Mya arenaria]